MSEHNERQWRSFEPFEVIGIIIPGAILLYGCTLLAPGLREGLQVRDLSLGDFGMTLILAFGCGHLLQAFGNAIDRVWWELRDGQPSDWLRTRKRALLTEDQRQRVLEAMVELDILASPEAVDALPRGAWMSVVRELYSYLFAQGKTVRIDSFFRTYVLFRGLVAVLVALLGIELFAGGGVSALAVVPLVGGIVFALQRMSRFNVHYSKELFLTFLNLQRLGSKGSTRPPSEVAAGEAPKAA